MGPSCRIPKRQLGTRWRMPILLPKKSVCGLLDSVCVLRHGNLPVMLSQGLLGQGHRGRLPRL